MTTKAERIRALEDKQAQIRAQIQALRARDSAMKRREDARRKIVIGGTILKMLKAGEIKDSWLRDAIDKHASERDRKLFETLPGNAQTQAAILDARAGKVSRSSIDELKELAEKEGSHASA